MAEERSEIHTAHATHATGRAVGVSVGVPVPMSGFMAAPRSVPVSLRMPVAVAWCFGAALGAGRPVRRKRGFMHRGHRPIIARTTGAPCSPRPN